MSHIQGTDNEDVYEYLDLSGTQKMAYFWLTKKVLMSQSKMHDFLVFL
jgi:hypothetical protein